MALTTVKPSPGWPMFRSASRMSKPCLLIASSASGTLLAVVTSKPCCSRMGGRVSRIAGSSSTISTRGACFSAIASPSLGRSQRATATTAWMIVSALASGQSGCLAMNIANQLGSAHKTNAPLAAGPCLSNVPGLLIHRNFYDLLLNRVGHQLCLVVDVQLAHQVEFVRFHRLDAEPKQDRNFLHGVAFGEQLQHLAFPRRQGRNPGTHLGVAHPRAKILHQLSQDLRAEVFPPLIDVAYRGHQLRRRGVFQYVTGSAHLQALHQVVLVFVHR